jgi:hypothetical protein
MANQRQQALPKEPSKQQPQKESQKEPQAIHEARQAISRLTQAITAAGVHLDIGLIDTTAQAHAACEMLVMLGLCSAEQMDTLILGQVRGILANVLQQLEQRKLAQAKREAQAATGLQVVKRPEIVVAKH